MRIRKRVLDRDPLCAECKKFGLVVEAEEVDHIVALCHGGSNEESNLQGLCIRCHIDKTAHEVADKTGAKFVSKDRFGVDGWPLKRISD